MRQFFTESLRILLGPIPKNNNMQFTTVDEFDSEFSKLFRKYRSLEEDLEVLKRYLSTYPQGYKPIVYRIPKLGIETKIYKVKRFRCKSLNRGSRSGIRVIYAYFEPKDTIEFVEIYYKEKDNIECNKNRIRKYYK